MKKRSLLFSLLVIFLFSCQHEPSDDVLPQKSSEIQQLEQDYGITFKEVSGEVDTTNALVIPFEELKQFLKNNALGTRAGSPIIGKGRYSNYGLLFTFNEVSLLNNTFGVGLEFQLINGDYKLDVSVALFSKSSFFQLLDKYTREEITKGEIVQKTWNTSGAFKAQTEVYANTTVSGKWYRFSYRVDFELKLPRRVTKEVNFRALLTINYCF